MTRHVCVHGHFYQPPRENPWLDVVEEQPSAAPYHDWNQRIAAESYRPNTAARVLAGDGRIARILNNFGGISFNIGPTLLAWMEKADPDTYEAILRGDRESAARFGGFGSALAMPYNHMIMPLASDADVRTQVAWGVRDFEWRFGRRPDGMWLPETAVDLRTLEALVEEGIRFTVLAPRQARRFRAPDVDEWTEVSADEQVDPKRPYRQRLPSGAEIAVFFYDGPISAAVAFEDLLADGERLANRLEGAFDHREGDQLVHIATDGETFGHHHTYGEMALAYVLDRFESAPDIALTNYAQYLDGHPPEWEAEIANGTSWSCAHGVERWRADCGCSTGSRPEWSQAWRGPLRVALDDLRDALADRFDVVGRDLLDRPWNARDEYIELILDGSQSRRNEFLARHAPAVHDAADRSRVWRLLEGQRHAMLMFTSCGWFFDDLDGLEARQIFRYADRAIEVAGTPGMRSALLERLAAAAGNRPDSGSGRDIFGDEVGRSRVTAEQIASWWAASASSAGTTRAGGGPPVFPAWAVVESALREDTVDGARLVTGRLHVTSTSVVEDGVFDFAALFRFAGDLRGGVRRVEPGDEGDPASPLAVLREHGAAKAMEVLEEQYSAASIGMDTLARVRRSRGDQSGEALGAYAAEALVALAERWLKSGDPAVLGLASSMLDVVSGLPAAPDLWEAQNAWFRLGRSVDSGEASLSAEQRDQIDSISDRLGLSRQTVASRPAPDGPATD